MNKPYSRPILSTIFDLLGALVLIGAGLAIIGGFVSEGERYLVGSGLVGVVVAIFYFGIAQVIDFLGRSAHHSERLCGLIETSLSRQLQSIEQRLSSATPILVRMDRVSTVAPSSGTRRGAVYHYSIDGNQEGPFSAADLKDFCDSGVITADTPVFREGDAQWRTYGHYPDLHR